MSSSTAVYYNFFSSKSNISKAILLILYAVGLVGVTLPLHPDFMLLTPANLLVTFLVALYAQEKIGKGLIAALVFCYLFGVFIELVGVQTGLLFGEYSYGSTLGPKIWGTPLIIGLNWAMLVYASASLSNSYLAKASLWVKAIIGASMMVFLDLWIEPAAVRYDFWSWSAAPLNSLIVAPWQNYAVWWLAALGLQFVFHRLAPDTRNGSIELLFGLQLFFFIWIFFMVVS